MATGTADPVSRSLDNRCFVQTLPRQTITFYPAQPFTETHPKEHPQTMSGTADELAATGIIAIPVQAHQNGWSSAPDSVTAS